MRLINRVAIVCALLLCAGISISSAAGIPTKSSEVERIDVASLKKMLQTEGVLVIDTRTQGQWLRAKDKAAGAQRLQTKEEFDTFKQEVARDTAIVTYCT